MTISSAVQTSLAITLILNNKQLFNPPWKIRETAFEVSDVRDECRFLSHPPALVRIHKMPTSVKEKVFFLDFLDADLQEFLFL